MFDEQLSEFTGKVVKSITAEAMDVSGTGPLRLLFSFEDGSTMWLVADKIPIRCDTRARYFELYPPGSLSPFSLKES